MGIHWDMVTLMVITIMVRDITEGMATQMGQMDTILKKTNKTKYYPETQLNACTFRNTSNS